MPVSSVSKLLPEITDVHVEYVNHERKRRQLPPISRYQAQTIIQSQPQSRREDDSFDMVGFLIGYTTGFPYPSPGGIVGAFVHPHSDPTAVMFETKPERPYEPPAAMDSSPSSNSFYNPPAPDTSPSPSYDPPAPDNSPTPSYDPPSPSYDRSPSFDSGSSSMPTDI